MEEKQRKEHEAHEAEMKKIQDEKDRITKELKEKRIAEKQAETDRLAKIEAEKKKGDKEKMLDLVADLEKIRHYKFESESYQILHLEIVRLIENWIPVQVLNID